MKTTGICRKIDDLGRVVIPSEFRTSLELSGGVDLEISMEGDRIILQKPQHHCSICGETDNISKIKDKYLCKDCITLIKKS